MSTHAIERALWVIQRPGGWTQGAEVRSKATGNSVTFSPRIHDVAENSYCGLGALMVAGAEDDDVQFLEDLSRDIYGDTIAAVNDGDEGDEDTDFFCGEIEPSVCHRRVVVLFQLGIRLRKRTEAGHLPMTPRRRREEAGVP